tara:strand:+ start:3050 stop:6208 length:3159 start_codon:yes stop_codon:yes gene_type:complete
MALVDRYGVTRKEPSESRVFTAADIAGSSTLQSKGYQPGDTLVTASDGTRSVTVASPEQRMLAAQLDVIDNTPSTPVPETIQAGERSLTQEDIRGSETLFRKGYLPGDVLVTSEDGSREVRREYSDGSLAVPDGEAVTEEMLASSTTLRERGASVGDVIVTAEDGTRSIYDATPTGLNSTIKELIYGFDKGGSLITNAGAFLDARFPIPFFSLSEGFLSATEVFGQDFMDATVPERVDMLARQKERDLIEEYGYNELYGQDGGFAQTAGAFTKALADPTNLIPLTKAPLAAAGISAVLGGAYEALEQARSGADYNPSRVAAVASGSALFGGAITKGLNVLSRSKANKMFDAIQVEVNRAAASGLRGDDVIAQTLRRTGLSMDDLDNVVEKSSRDLLSIPTKKSARKALVQAMTQDAAVSRVNNPTIDRVLGALSTRIGNHSQVLKYRMREFDAMSHINTAKYLHRVEPFIRGFRKLAKPLQKRVGLHLVNQELDAAKDILRKAAPELVDSLSGAKSALDDIGEELQEAGVNINLMDNYWPRLLTDMDSLMIKMGRQPKNFVDRQMGIYAKGLNRNVEELTSEQKSEVYDMLFRKYRVILDKNGKPKFVYGGNRTDPTTGSLDKGRVIPKLTEDMLDSYASVDDAIALYIRKAMNEVETRKLFGRTKGGVATDDAGKVDFKRSIGNLVNDEISAGRVSTDAVPELMQMLSARFEGGNQTPHAMMRVLRDLGYLGTIANPLSAIKQLGDLANSAWIYGLRDTLGAAFSRKDMRIIDIGLEQISAEMADPGLLSKALMRSLSGTGFRAVDRFGKETTINAAIRAARRKSLNPVGRQELRKKYGDMFGGSFDSFIDDLQRKSMSDNVKVFAFNELADIQPTTHLEMPELWNANPNLRILYSLKSFTLKMWDLARNKIWNEWQSGSKVTAAANMARMGAYLAVANVGTEVLRDMLRGKEVNPDDLPNEALWALLGVFGANKYTSDRYLRNGDITDAGWALIRPPTPIIDALVKLPSDVIQGEVDDNLWNYVRPLPATGDLMYYWLGDGIEKSKVYED